MKQSRLPSREELAAFIRERSGKVGAREIARELDDDPRPMKQRRSQYEAPDGTGGLSLGSSWLVFSGFVVVLALAIWAGTRLAPPEL